MAGALLRKIATAPATAPAQKVVGYTSQAWGNTTAPVIDLTALTWVDDTSLDVDDVVFIAVGFADFGGVSPEDPTMSTAGYTAAHAVLSEATLNTKTKLRTFYKRMGATPDTSVQSGNFVGDRSGAVAVLVLRNVHIDILDATSTTATGNGSSNANPPAITPVTPNAWVVPVGFGGDASTAGYSISGLAQQTTAATGITGGHAGCRIVMGAYTAWTSGSYDPPAASSTNNGAQDSWCAASIAVKPTDVTGPPIFTVDPVIVSNSGFVGDGDTFTATPGTANGFLVGYEWLLDGVGTGDTDLTYTAGPGDVGKTLTFAHTQINFLGSTTKQSNALGPIVTPTYSTANRKTSDGNDRKLSDGTTRISKTRTA